MMNLTTQIMIYRDEFGLCHFEERSDEESLLVDILLWYRFFAYAQNDLPN